MTVPHLDPFQTAALVAWLGKIFIDLADSMPPPPAACGFWCRWFHDFVQKLASNGSRVGAVRP